MATQTEIEEAIMELDLTITTTNPVFAGCAVVEIDKDRFRLPTPDDEDLMKILTVKIGTNILKIISEVPIFERGEKLVLTGQAPSWVYLIALQSAGPLFKRLAQLNGNTGIEIEIPMTSSPPSEFLHQEVGE